MNKEKFPEYREKVFQYIQEEILPKYSEIELCSMHVLPNYMAKDVEFIFKIKKSKFNLLKRHKSIEDWEDELYYLLHDCCQKMGEPYYYFSILTIFKES